MSKASIRSTKARARANLMAGVSAVAVTLVASGAWAQDAADVGAVVSGSTFTTVAAGAANEQVVTTTNVNKAGKVAFNQFDKFEVADKRLVTLVLPSDTYSLVNVVRSAVKIDGTVTSRLVDANGTIGGNLFFLTTGGMFVGATGTINTGRLIVRGGDTKGNLLSTDALAGSTDAFDVNGLLSYAPTSVISIDGKVVAPGGVDLAATKVTFGAGASVLTGAAGIEALQPQAAAVSMKGIDEGAQLVRVNGGIAITGTAEVKVGAASADLAAALLDARPYATADAPTTVLLDGGITIASSGAIDLGGKLTAWDGGPLSLGADIKVKAERKANVDDDYLSKVKGNYFADIKAATSVAVTGAMVGQNVSIESVASSITLSDPEIALLNLNPQRAGIEFLMDYAQTRGLLGVAGLDAFFTRADASSALTVGSAAAITARTDLTLNALSAATAEGFSSTTADGSAKVPGVALAVGVALLKSKATITSDGALSAGRDLSVKADNRASSALSLTAVSTKKSIAAGVAYSDIDVDAAVTLGGSLDAKTVSVLASNGQAATSTNKGFTNASNVIAKDGSPAGGSAAVLKVNVDSNVTVTAAIGAKTKATTVDINAENSINAVRNHGGADIDSGILSQIFALPVVAAGSLDALLPTVLGKVADTIIEKLRDVTPATVDQAKKSAHVGAAVAVLDNHQAAVTKVSGSIDAYGAVTVGSKQYDSTVRNTAKAAVSAERPVDGNAATVAGAVAYGETDYVSNATLGGKVTSQTMAVNATTERPLGKLVEVPLSVEDTSKKAAAMDWASDKLGYLRYGATPDKGLFGNAAGATAATDSAKMAAISGSVSYAKIDADTRAWIDPGAQIDVTKLDVQATTALTLLSLSGAIPLGQLGVGTNGGAATGLGVVYNLVTPTTLAGIGKGALVTTRASDSGIAESGVNVQAKTDLVALTLAPQSGASNGATGSGSFAINEVDGRTQATISKDARLDLGASGKLTLKALTAMEVTAVGGSLTITKVDGSGGQSTPGSIGVTGALNMVDFETKALVGDAGGDEKPDDTTAAAADAGITAADVIVDASSTGMVNALSIAGSVTDSSTPQVPVKDPPTTGQKAKRKLATASAIVKERLTSYKSGVIARGTKAAEDAAFKADVARFMDLQNGATADNQFGVAGSASVNLTELKTIAETTSAVFKRPAETTASGRLDVHAAEGVDLMAVSGGAAIAAGNPAPSKSVMIGGAFGLSYSRNEIAATMTSTTANDFATVDVAAAANGLRIGSGMALAVDATKTEEGAAAAASVSVLIARDGARAAIEGGSITGAGKDTGGLSVTAYNGMIMGAGAGALSVSGSNAVGGGVTVVDIASPEGGAANARIVGTPISEIGSVTVRGLTAARIAGVAAAGGIALTSDQTKAAVTGTLALNLVSLDTTALIDVGKDGAGSISVGGAVKVDAGDLGQGEVASLANEGRSGDTAGTSMLDEYKLGTGVFGNDDPVSTSDLRGGTQILTVALPVSVSQGQSAGLGVSWNQVDNDRTASIIGGAKSDGTTTIEAGSLAIAAAEHTDIMAFGVGVGVSSQGVGIMGSIAANLVTGSSFAGLGRSPEASDNLKVKITGAFGDTPNISVTASGDGGLFSLAGGVGVGSKSAVGFSIGVNQIKRTTDAGDGGVDTEETKAGVHAAIDGVTLSGTPDVDVLAATRGRIVSNAVGVAVSAKEAGIAGAASANELAPTTEATVRRLSYSETAPGDLAIRGEDASSILSIGLVVGIGKEGGAAAGVSVNDIDSDVSATLTVADKEAIKTRNLLIESVATAGTAAFGLGVGGGQSFGGAGSVAVNLSNSDVTSRLVQTGGTVNTAGSIGVVARRDTTIDIAGGAIGFAKQGAGIGASVVVNVLGGSATAEILGTKDKGTIKAFTSNGDVNGDGNDDGEGLAITKLRTGELTDGALPQFDAFDDFASQSLGTGGITFGLETASVRGVAVNASSTATMRTVAIAGGATIQGAAVGVTGVVNNVTGTTKSTVTEADIEVGKNKNDAVSLDVRSSSQTVGMTFAGAIAGSGDVAVAVPLVTDGFGGTTSATVTGGKINSHGTLAINAIANQASTALVVGGAGSGKVAAAVGSVSPRFDQTVSATLDRPNAVDVDGAGGVAVNAESSATSLATFNAIAGSQYAAGAGAIVVVTNENTTTASYIGRRDGDKISPVDIKTPRFSVTAEGAFDSALAASSGAAAAGGALVANGVGVVHRGTVSASADGLSYSRTDGSVDVTALERVSILPVVGSIAIGASPFGGGASLGVIAVLSQSKVDATLTQPRIDAKSVRVDASGYNQIDAGQLGISGGGLGIGANVTYLGIGKVLDTGALLASPTGETTDSAVAEAAGSDGSKNVNLEQLAEGGSTSAAKFVQQAARELDDTQQKAAVGDDSGRRAFAQIGAPGEDAESRVRAQVVGTGGQGKIDVSDTLSITSNANLRSKSTNAQLTGGSAGAAGTIAITRNAAFSSAYLGDVRTSGKALTVTATTGQERAASAPATLLSPTAAAEAQIYAGVAGGAALAVGVADVRLQSAALADVKSDVDFAKTTIAATDKTDARARVVGGAFGANLALNVVSSTAVKDGTVRSQFGGRAKGNEGDSIAITADALGQTQATAYAGAGGGLFGGNAAVAIAKDTRTVRAIVAENTVFEAAALVRATSTPLVSAKAYGVVVAGGLAAGASVATASADGSVKALVGEGGIATEALDVSAQVLRPTDGDNVEAVASGSAGGLYVAVTGAVSTASTDVSTEAVLGEELNGQAGTTGFRAFDRLNVSATRDLAQHADTTGVTAGGLLAIGVQQADANSKGLTRAALENVDGSGRGAYDATIASDVTDRNVATVISGAGGTVAGLAAQAGTSSKGAALTEIWGTADKTFNAAMLTATARSTANYRADSDSLLATALGAGGTTARNVVSTTATTNIGSDAAGATATKLSAGTFRIGAYNDVGSGSGDDALDGGGARGAGGGVVSAAAVIVDNDVDQYATVNLRDGAQLRQKGGDARENTRATFIDAAITTRRQHGAALTLGGAVQAPHARIDSDYTAINAINIGDKALIRGDQGIGIGTVVNQDIADITAVKVYGASAIGGGSASSTSTVTQGIDVGDTTRIESLMDVRISTGTSANGSDSDLLRIAAQADTFNWTLIPISTESETDAKLTGRNTLTLGTAVIRAGRDIIAEALKSKNSVTASGTGHNPYLELVRQTSKSGVPTVDVTGGMKLAGSVLTAGYLAERTITINADGSITRTDVGDSYASEADRLGQYDAGVGTFDALGYINAQIADLTTEAGTLGLTVPVDPNGADDPVTARQALNEAAAKSALIAQIAGLFETRGALRQSGVNGPRSAAIVGGKLTDGRLIGNGIFAAGGVVALNSGSIAGSGTITAKGGGKVTIVNNSSLDTVVGDVFVPMKPAGLVTFGGPATGVPGEIKLILPTDGDVAAGAVSVTTGASRSDIVILGNVQNIGGAFAAKTLQGNYVQFGEVNAATFSAEAPNGLFSVSLGDGSFSQGQPLAFYYGNAGLSLYTNPANRGPSQDNGASRTPFTAQNAAILLANYFATKRVGIEGEPGGYDALLLAYISKFKKVSADVLYDLYINNSGNTSSDGQPIERYKFDTNADVLRSSTIWSSCFQECEYFSNNDNLGGVIGVKGSLGFDGNDDAAFPNDYFYTTPGLSYRSPVIVSDPVGYATALPKTYPASRDGKITANQVIVTAKNIDVSGTITAGPTKERTLTIANSVVRTTQFGNNTPIPQARTFGQALADSYDTVVDLLQPVRADSSSSLKVTYGQAGTGNIGARFIKTQTAAVNGEAVGYIQVDDVLAGSGGVISLNGKILNSNPLGGGKLKVLNGYANIAIDNQTPYEIRLGTLNAGLSVDGRITLRDQGRTTEYVNTAGGGITQTTTTGGGLTTVKTYTGEGLSDQNPLKYQPDGRVYYVWDDSRQIERAVEASGDLELRTVMPWKFVEGGQSPQGGTFVDIDDTTGGDPGAAIRKALGSGIGKNPGMVQVVSGSVQEEYEPNFIFSGKYYYHLELPTKATIDVKTAVKATYPIAIVFDGSGDGGIRVTSRNGGAITLTDALTYGAGRVTLDTNNAISQRDGGIAIGRELWLDAGTGIGALTGSGDTLTKAPFRGSVNGGFVRAVTGAGDIALDLQAIGVVAGTAIPLRLHTISAPNGSVAVTTDGGFYGLDFGSSTANIIARDAITLKAAGSIGPSGGKITSLTSEALRIKLDGGVLNVAAAGDVAIEQVGLASTGELRLGSINATGDVLLRVPGSVVAADATATVDEAKLARFLTATRLVDLAPVCTANCGATPGNALDTSMRLEGAAAWNDLGGSADAEARARLVALFGYVPASREAIDTLAIGNDRKVAYQLRGEGRTAFDLYVLANPAAYAEQQRAAAVESALIPINAVAGLRAESAIAVSANGRSVTLVDPDAVSVRAGGSLYTLAQKAYADSNMAVGQTLSPEEVRGGVQLFLETLFVPTGTLLGDALPDVTGLDAAAARAAVSQAIGSTALVAWATDRGAEAQRAKATTTALGQIDAIATFARTSDAISVSAAGDKVTIVDPADATLAKGGVLYQIAQTSLRGAGITADGGTLDVARGLQLYLDQLHAPIATLISGDLPTLGAGDAVARYAAVSNAISDTALRTWAQAQSDAAASTLTTLYGALPTDRATVDTGTFDAATLARRSVGATWSQTMLDVAVPTTAFVPVADTQFLTRAPVITARGVSIVAGQSIGAFDAARTFTYDANGFVGSSADRDLAAAYLASSGPGDLTPTVTRDAQGKVTQVSFVTRREQPLTIAATGIVNAVAGTDPVTLLPTKALFAPIQGNVFLTNTSAMSLGTIVSQAIGDDGPMVNCTGGGIIGYNCGGRIRLVAPNITGVGSGAATLNGVSNNGRGLVMGRLVRIEASSGSIDGAEAASALMVDARALEVLRAAGSIQIVRRKGVSFFANSTPVSNGNDMQVGDVFAGGRFALDNPFGSLSVVRLPSSLDSENRNARIVADSVAIRAAGDIGSADTTGTGIDGAFDVETPWVERFVAGYDFGKQYVGVGSAPAGIASGNGYLALRGATRLGGSATGGIDLGDYTFGSIKVRASTIGARNALTLLSRGPGDTSIDLRANIRVGGIASITTDLFRLGADNLIVGNPLVYDDQALANLSALRLDAGRFDLVTARSITLDGLRASGTVESTAGSVTINRSVGTGGTTPIAVRALRDVIVGDIRDGVVSLASAAGDVRVTGKITASDVTLTGRDVTINGGEAARAAITAAPDGIVTINDDLRITDKPVAGLTSGVLTLQGGTVTVNRGITAGTSATIDAATVNLGRDGSFRDTGVLSVTATKALNMGDRARLENVREATLRSPTRVALDRFFGGSLSIDAPGMTIGKVDAANDVTLIATGEALLNQRLTVGGLLDISAATIRFAQSDLLGEAGSLKLIADTFAGPAQSLVAKGLVVLASRDDLALGRVDAAGGTIRVDAGSLDIGGSVRTTGAALTLSAEGTTHLRGALDIAGNLSADGATLLFDGPITLRGRFARPTLNLGATGALTGGVNARIGADTADARVALHGESVTTPAAIRNAKVTVASTGAVSMGDIVTDGGPTQTVMVRAVGDIALGAVTSSDIYVKTREGIVVVGALRGGTMAVAGRGAMTIGSVEGQAATFASARDAIDFTGPVTIADAAQPGRATLTASAAHAIRINAAMSASGGIALTGATVTTLGEGTIGDAGSGALMQLRANTTDVRFAIEDASAPAMRLDVKGARGGLAQDTILRFGSLRPPQFDAFWSRHGWIDSAAAIGIGSLSMSRYLLLGSGDDAVLVSRNRQGPAAPRRIVSGPLTGAKLTATPRAKNGPKVTITQ